MPAGNANSISGRLERGGYAVVDDALNGTEVSVLCAALAPLWRRTPTGRNAFEGRRTKRVYGLLAKTRATDALVASEFLNALAREWIGHHQLSAHVAVEVGPQAAGQELHTDDAIYPVERPHDDLVLSAIWALDDLTPDRAATRVVPASHRGDVEPPAQSARPVELRAGGLLLYRGALWHAVGANRSDRSARFVHTEYIASWLRPLETHLLQISRATARNLPARLQELVGYNIRPPYTGSVNGRHPRRALRRLRLLPN
jgi:ectoine hydroxylase-related dioxygenase (phytanoyl-CoA dioxygenase family)